MTLFFLAPCRAAEARQSRIERVTDGEAMLNRVPGKLVIDHIGKFLGPTQPDSEAFLCLRRLLDKGNCWVKLSAPYESSRNDAPEYADVAPLMRVLALHYPDRPLMSVADRWTAANCPFPSSPISGKTTGKQRSSPWG